MFLFQRSRMLPEFYIFLRLCVSCVVFFNLHSYFSSSSLASSFSRLCSTACSYFSSSSLVSSFSRSCSVMRSSFSSLWIASTFQARNTTSSLSCLFWYYHLLHNRFSGCNLLIALKNHNSQVVVFLLFFFAHWHPFSFVTISVFSDFFLFLFFSLFSPIDFLPVLHWLVLFFRHTFLLMFSRFFN